MRLNFCFLGQKEFQHTYLPAKVGFLCTDVINWVSLFFTSTSRKGRERVLSFSKMKQREEIGNRVE